MAIVNGYKNVYCPNHPSATTNGMVYEHVLIAEQKIGRHLTKGEVVHHIDHNRSNNSPDNLLIFASKSDHSSFHQGGKLVIDEYGIAHCIKKINTCKICGKPIPTATANHCADCYRILERRVQRPSRDELKRLIRTKTFVEIGNMFHVTDKAIRKWCASMNLPKSKNKIKQISDLDWEKI